MVDASDGFSHHTYSYCVFLLAFLASPGRNIGIGTLSLVQISPRLCNKAVTTACSHCGRSPSKNSSISYGHFSFSQYPSEHSPSQPRPRSYLYLFFAVSVHLCFLLTFISILLRHSGWTCFA